MQRGEVWWADLGSPHGSAPALRRPVVIVQSDRFNRSRLRTVIVVAVTTNLRLGAMPGNVILKKEESGLPADSVANITQVATMDEGDLTEMIGVLPVAVRQEIDSGLRMVLELTH